MNIIDLANFCARECRGASQSSAGCLCNRLNPVPRCPFLGKLCSKVTGDDWLNCLKDYGGVRRSVEDYYNKTHGGSAVDTFSINNSVLVNIDYSIWTGRAKLDAADIPDAAVHMPPRDLCSAGSIKIFDTNYLKQFRNFKTAADLAASAVGCKVMNAWLVDEKNLPALETELDKVHAAWRMALHEFEAFYPERAKGWADACAPWDALVRAKQPMEHEIGGKFRFAWQTFRLAPENPSITSQGNETDTLVQSIPDKALMSVIDALHDLYEDSFNKPTNPSPKAYGALRRIAERAQALGFANPNAARLAPVLVDLVNRKDHTLARLVLSRMSAPKDVEDILNISAGQGIDSLLVPTEEIQLAPTAMEVARQTQAQDSLLAQANALLTPMQRPEPVSSMDVLDSLGLF